MLPPPLLPPPLVLELLLVLLMQQAPVRQLQLPQPALQAAPLAGCRLQLHPWRWKAPQQVPQQAGAAARLLPTPAPQRGGCAALRPHPAAGQAA